MSAEAAQEVRERRHQQIVPDLDDFVRQQMVCVREAFRLRRLARQQRHLHGLYYEHSLFNEAGGARREMMHLLRTARASWRNALGLAP